MALDLQQRATQHERRRHNPRHETEKQPPEFYGWTPLKMGGLPHQFTLLKVRMFYAAIGFVAQIGLKSNCPLSWTDLAYDLCDRYAKR